MRRCVNIALALLGSTLGWAQDAYEIGPKDVVRLVVIGQAELSADFEVDPDGMLTLPLLGKVKAGDLTAQELEKKLTTLLADGYLKRPQVSVSIREFRSQNVFVTGEVPRPGTYSLKADRTLLALLGDIGSLGPNAGYEVVIMRPPPSDSAVAAPVQPAEIPTDTDSAAVGLAVVPGAEVIRVSLRRLQAGDLDQNVTLKAGDTIYFPPARQFYISGQVARPGSYKYQEGMTVLQALTLAGGVTPRGSAGRTKIVRTVDEGGEQKREELKARMEDPIQPEDTLVVPERFF